MVDWSVGVVKEDGRDIEDRERDDKDDRDDWRVERVESVKEERRDDGRGEAVSFFSSLGGGASFPSPRLS